MGIFKRLAEWIERNNTTGTPIDERPSAETAETAETKPNMRIIDAMNRERVKLLQEDPDEYFRRYPMPRFDF